MYLPRHTVKLSANASTDDQAPGAGGIVSSRWSIVPSVCLTPGGAGVDCTPVVHDLTDNLYSIQYVPTWSSEVSHAAAGPGNTSVAVTVTDAYGLASTASGVIVTRWPALQLVFKTPTVVSQAVTAVAVQIVFNDTDKALIPLFWRYNVTTWSATDASGAAIVLACGNSSTCWLPAVVAAGNYTVAVAVRLVADYSASPLSYDCPQCSYSASARFRKSNPTLGVAVAAGGTALGGIDVNCLGAGTTGADFVDMRDFSFFVSGATATAGAAGGVSGSRQLGVTAQTANGGMATVTGVPLNQVRCMDWKEGVWLCRKGGWCMVRPMSW